VGLIRAWLEVSALAPRACRCWRSHWLAARGRSQRWFFGQLGALLDRLQSTPDAAGTLLDNTTVLCVSEFGGPNANSTAAQHSTRNLPYLLIGGANTPFRTGQSLIDGILR
jgi:hypothetical protein